MSPWLSLLPSLSQKSLAEKLKRPLNQCPLQNVHVRKVKLLKQPKFDLGALLALHGEGATTEETGKKVAREFKETILEAVVNKT